MNKVAVVSYRDGTSVTSVVYPNTQVAFERAYGRSFIETFDRSDQLFAEWVAFIGWFASPAELPFDEWLKTISDVRLGLAEPDEE